MIDYKYINTEVNIDEFDLATIADLDGYVKYEISRGLTKYILENGDELTEEGLVYYSTRRDEHTNSKIFKMRMNLISDKELNRLLEMEQELEIYYEIMKKRREDFFRGIEGGKQ